MGLQALNVMRAGAGIRAGRFTIIPIERVQVMVDIQGGRLLGLASKSPVGVVIMGAGPTRAVDPRGGPLDLEELLSRTEGLRELL